MAIQQVRIQVNGTWHTLTQGEDGQWTGQFSAPAQTSFNLSGGYYPVTVEATNDAGTSTTVDSNSPTIGESLRLVVREKIAPVISITSPQNNAHVSNNQQPITFTVTDEAGGSGVNPDSIVVKINGANVDAVDKQPITNGYSCTATPTALKDGQCTVTVDAADNDGNAAVQQSIVFYVDTIAPTLDVTSPAEGLVTATAAITVAGTTNDATSSPVTIQINVNGTDQGAIPVQDGAFSKSVTLQEGANTIIVTATDGAGKQTQIERHVTLDTSVPNITSVTLVPNPADAGATVVVTVVVS